MGIQQGARLVVGWVLLASQEYKEAEEGHGLVRHWIEYLEDDTQAVPPLGKVHLARAYHKAQCEWGDWMGPMVTWNLDFASGEYSDADHRYWFTPYTLAKVCSHAGYIVQEINFCEDHKLTRTQFTKKLLLKNSYS